MKNKFVLLFIFFFIFINQNFAQSQEKIMFLDVDYIFSQSSIGKNIREQINSKAAKLDVKKKKYKADLEKEKKDLISKKNILSEQEFNEKIKKLDIKVKNINEKVFNENKDLLSFKKKAELEFSKKLTETLQEYVNAKNVQLVINKKNVLIGKSEFDTTSDILSMLDKKIKKIKIK